MEEGNKRSIKWIAIVSGVVFLILIGLVVAGVLSILWLIFGFFGLLIIGSVIAALIILVKKSREKSAEKQGEIIDLPTTIMIANEVQFYPEVLDYWEKVIMESPSEYYGAPGNKIPIYIKVGETLFEQKILGVLVNRSSGEAFWEIYDDLRLSPDEIVERLRAKANLTAKIQVEEPSTEEEVIERPGGEHVVRKRTVKPEEAKKEEEEASL